MEAVRAVPRVVGGGVHPADPEPGHHQDRRADHRAGPAGRQAAGRAEVEVVQGQRDVDQGGGDHRDRQPLLQPHDGVEAEDPGRHDHPGDQQEGDHLGEGAVAPAEPAEDGGGREGRQRDQHGLPADQQQVGHHARDAVAVAAERRTREHQRRGGAALPGDRDQPDQQEREHRADHGGEEGLAEAQPEAEHEGAVGDREHRHVRGAPGPEQLGRSAPALGLVDDVDAVGLDAETGRGGGWCGDAHRGPLS